MISKITGILLVLTTLSSHAAEVCPKLYDVNLTDEALVQIEKTIVTNRMAKNKDKIVFENCILKVNNAIDANAVRYGLGGYGQLLIVSGIESNTIYSCDGVIEDGKLKMFIKIKRFEPTSYPAVSQQFGKHGGCPGFNKDNSPYATVESSYSKLVN